MSSSLEKLILECDRSDDLGPWKDLYQFFLRQGSTGSFSKIIWNHLLEMFLRRIRESNEIPNRQVRKNALFIVSGEIFSFYRMEDFSFITFSLKGVIHFCKKGQTLCGSGRKVGSLLVEKRHLLCTPRGIPCGSCSWSLGLLKNEAKDARVLLELRKALRNCT